MTYLSQLLQDLWTKLTKAYLRGIKQNTVGARSK